MGRRLEKTFFQRGHADGKQVPEKTLNIANYQRNQNHNELTPVRMAIIKKTTNKKCC